MCLRLETPCFSQPTNAGSKPRAAFACLGQRIFSAISTRILPHWRGNQHPPPRYIAPWHKKPRRVCNPARHSPRDYDPQPLYRKLCDLIIRELGNRLPDPSSIAGKLSQIVFARRLFPIGIDGCKILRRRRSALPKLNCCSIHNDTPPTAAWQQPRQ